MVTSADLTHEEWKIVYNAPIRVASTSMTIGTANVLKAMKVVFIFILVLIETSKHFPENECIQAIITMLRKPKDDPERISLHDLDPKTTFDGQLRRGGKEEAIVERKEYMEHEGCRNPSSKKPATGTERIQALVAADCE